MDRSARTTLPSRMGSDESWMSFLERHGLISLLLPPEARSKVIEPAESLWRWSVRDIPSEEVIQLHLVYRHDDKSSTGIFERPKTPVDFLEALRRQRIRVQPEQIQVGPLTLPAVLGHVAEAIAGSRCIVDLKDDWDGEGSLGYEELTWLRAARLVAKSSIAFWRTCRAVPPAPGITPGPDGSIDMVWRSEGRKLVINIPEEPHSVATFYGKDRNDEHGFLRGELHLSRDGEWLLAWLTR